jgi:N,N'-diacetyllegionaminate synthase
MSGGWSAVSNIVFSLGNRLVAPGQPCLIIGEVAQAHDGSLGMAHAFIDAIANAGADAVKFQTHIAKAESTPAEPWRVKFSQQDATRMDYWRRMEFTGEQWSGLKRHAEERGLLFISSPFSVEAADLLDRLDIKLWKIASGEVNNQPLFDRCWKLMP